MKKLSFKEWFLFILLAIFSLWLWYKFSYPEFKFVNLSIERKKALEIAKDYLKSQGINLKDYRWAVVFITDDWADRYLQKTIGPMEEEKFLKEQNYELFSWRVRFFKELEKEEYNFNISAKTGQILSFIHLIEETKAIQDIEKEPARLKAEEFLQKRYGLNLEDYEFHEEKIKRYEKRIDYSFWWQKKGIYLPWQKDKGTAKLLIGATVCGDRIREFYKAKLDIPEAFQRYVENQFNLGNFLSGFSFIFFILFLFFSIVLVIKRKQTLAVRLTKTWFIYLTVFLGIVNFLYILNNLQNIIISYPTSVSYNLYLVNYFMSIFLNLVFIVTIFIMPGLAGESLREEVLTQNKYSSFFYYLKSTFLSRSLSGSIIFGYLLFFILLGLQSVIFYFGQRYIGVWKEWMRMSQFSSTYIPFLSAFIIGINASLSEEVLFRLFCISYLKKYFKNIILAVIFSAFIWGLGHTGYAIFPVWFRVLEVGLLGCLFGFSFLRYGLIVVLVAHYLFDVFWGVSAYLLGKSNLFLFSGALLVLFLPILIAIIIWFLNKEEKEKEIKFLLTPTEKYNLNILINFISTKKLSGLSAEKIKEELISYNWDSLLVDLAIKEVFS